MGQPDLLTIQVKLPWPPAVNRLWRRRGNHIYKTTTAKKYQEEAAELIRQAAEGKRYAPSARVRAEAIMFPPDRRKRDIDGPVKTLLDSIEESGVIVNDNQIKALVLEMRDIELKEADMRGCVMLTLTGYCRVED